DAAAPELVRVEAMSALAAMRAPAALDALAGSLTVVVEPRLRRSLAKALGRFRGVAGVGALADRLVEVGDREDSLLTAGDFFNARGALEHPGAAPVLRARMKRSSWNERLRAGCVRGMGASGEAAAIDDVLGVLGDRTEHHLVTQAACEAACALGSRHLIARSRIRRALEPLLDSDRVHLRMAAASALAALGDPDARSAISMRMGREGFGNVRRTLRETIETLDRSAAVTIAVAEIAKRVDDLEQAKKRLELRLDAFEKRMDPPAT
ncbi:MAG: HEAT repeat domain-containing protein, partial [Planctomycetes bacterium]|nr:HEAT repeat domain-containing protein [Planctomycetota bacterium]